MKYATAYLALAHSMKPRATCTDGARAPRPLRLPAHLDGKRRAAPSRAAASAARLIARRKPARASRHWCRLQPQRPKWHPHETPPAAQSPHFPHRARWGTLLHLLQLRSEGAGGGRGADLRCQRWGWQRRPHGQPVAAADWTGRRLPSACTRTWRGSRGAPALRSRRPPLPPAAAASLGTSPPAAPSPTARVSARGSAVRTVRGGEARGGAGRGGAGRGLLIAQSTDHQESLSRPEHSSAPGRRGTSRGVAGRRGVGGALLSSADGAFRAAPPCARATCAALRVTRGGASRADRRYQAAGEGSLRLEARTGQGHTSRARASWRSPAL
jgi:hypothetical protein